MSDTIFGRGFLDQQLADSLSRMHTHAGGAVDRAAERASGSVTLHASHTKYHQQIISRGDGPAHVFADTLYTLCIRVRRAPADCLEGSVALSPVPIERRKMCG